jgi:hypothetical protein
LNWCVETIPPKTGSQDWVSFYDMLPGLFEGWHMQFLVEANQHLLDIYSRMWSVQAME